MTRDQLLAALLVERYAPTRPEVVACGPEFVSFHEIFLWNPASTGCGFTLGRSERCIFLSRLTFCTCMSTSERGKSPGGRAVVHCCPQIFTECCGGISCALDKSASTMWFIATTRGRRAVMDTVAERRGRINVALSVLSHRAHCKDCDDTIQTAIAALEGLPYEVLIREAS